MPVYTKRLQFSPYVPTFPCPLFLNVVRTELDRPTACSDAVVFRPDVETAAGTGPTAVVLIEQKQYDISSASMPVAELLS